MNMTPLDVRDEKSNQRTLQQVLITTLAIHVACGGMGGRLSSLTQDFGPYLALVTVFFPEIHFVILLYNLLRTVRKCLRYGRRGSARYYLGCLLNVQATVPLREEFPNWKAFLVDLSPEAVRCKAEPFSWGYFGSFVGLGSFIATAIASSVLGVRRLAIAGAHDHILDVRNCLMALSGVLVGFWVLLLHVFGSSWEMVPKWRAMPEVDEKRLRLWVKDQLRGDGQDEELGLWGSPLPYTTQVSNIITGFLEFFDYGAMGKKLWRQTLFVALAAFAHQILVNACLSLPTKEHYWQEAFPGQESVPTLQSQLTAATRLPDKKIFNTMASVALQIIVDWQPPAAFDYDVDWDYWKELNITLHMDMTEYSDALAKKDQCDKNFLVAALSKDGLFQSPCPPDAIPPVDFWSRFETDPKLDPQALIDETKSKLELRQVLLKFDADLTWKSVSAFLDRFVPYPPLEVAYLCHEILDFSSVGSGLRNVLVFAGSLYFLLAAVIAEAHEYMWAGQPTWSSWKDPWEERLWKV